MQYLFSTLCLALTTGVLFNAWYQKKQFYPAVVYVTKSNASMAVIYIQFFALVFMFGKLLRKIFLGQLRAAEFEHLLERFWYALTETCLAFTVFRDDFNPRFVALFTVLLFLKSFHWLAEERVDYMERSPVLGWLFHFRVATLLLLLGSLDYLLIIHAYNSTLLRGPTVQLVFGFEYAILLTVVASTITKYILHVNEMRTDTPWENKAVFLLYTELLIGFIKVILYVLFVVIMAKFYALPMFVFRPMFFTIRSFRKALNDVIMSRRAIRNMNTLYPDASPDELSSSDNICIICREDMVSHSKKLPCGHIFHTACLRSWFQRQQTCPTCRLNILRTPIINNTIPSRTTENNAGLARVRNINSNNIINPQNILRQTTTGNNPIMSASAHGAVRNASELPNTNGNSGNTIETNFTGLPSMPPPPFMMPPLPFISPYTVPPPPMPHDLAQLSEEEIRTLEGNERVNIEERLKLLRNIQTLLDTAGILMNNYQMVASRMQSTSYNKCSTSSGVISNVNTTDDVNKPSTSAMSTAQKSSIKHELSENLEESGDSRESGVVKNKSHLNGVALTNESKYNEVTIEDLGTEDQNDLASKNKPEGNSSAEHIHELRKRRLKFLDEQTHKDSSNK